MPRSRHRPATRRRATSAAPADAKGRILAVVAGIGVDACDVARMRQALDGPSGTRFVGRVFTSNERAYCDARGPSRAESYAARFAAKEAAMKALATGWGRGVGFRDVEVVRDTDAPPRLLLHGQAARIARRRRLGRWHLSLTHTRTTAIAWVLAELE